ncbi:MAG TPA: alpha/beta fold hydrolase [Acetobacteraceae bacterium]|nr:alpha/beta fold hydrolase [Acetobacteraceae bacterium]
MKHRDVEKLASVVSGVALVGWISIALAATLGVVPAAAAVAPHSCSPATSTWQSEASHYRQRFVTVAKDVKLEVLDWGGSGRPLVLLAGLGNTAHVFDDIAPELSHNFHVYGITRRGFGASSVPDSGYTADRLADDVVAVLDALKIERPIIAGHSIAGEDLSAIGSSHPARVAGLIYLDAAHGYAIYDPQRGFYLPDLRQLGAQVAHMHDDPLDEAQMEALLNDATALQRSLKSELGGIKTDEASAAGAAADEPGTAGMASFAAFRCFVSKQLGGIMPEDEVRQTFAATAIGGVGKQKTPDFVYSAILEGEARFRAPAVPILAIVPIPRASDLPVGNDPAKRLAADAMHTHMQAAEIETLQRQLPSAEIVRIPHGHHYIFLSNKSDVASAIVAFGSRLR